MGGSRQPEAARGAGSPTRARDTCWWWAPTGTTRSAQGIGCCGRSSRFGGRARPSGRSRSRPCPRSTSNDLVADTRPLFPPGGRSRSPISCARRRAVTPSSWSSSSRPSTGRGSSRSTTAQGRWTWDLPRIRAEGYTDNVVEFVVGKLRELPAETQDALKLAACLGASPTADALAIVFGRDPEIALRAALESDLLLQREGGYRFPPRSGARGGLRAHSGEVNGRRYISASGAGSSRARPQAMSKTRSSTSSTSSISGPALVTAPDERRRIAELNLAGREARPASHGLRLGARVFRHRAAISSARIPGRHARELTFALELHRAECEFVTRDFESAERRLEALTHRAATPTDAAAVACLQSDLYTTAGDSPRAVEASPRLSSVGSASIGRHIRPASRWRTSWRGCGRCSATGPIEELIDLPPMTDPLRRAMMEVFTMVSRTRVLHRRESVPSGDRLGREPDPRARHRRRFAPSLRPSGRVTGSRIFATTSGAFASASSVSTCSSGADRFG